MPTPANSDTSSANSKGPLDNSNVFSTATDTSPGSPKLQEPLPLFLTFITHHQLSTLVPPTHSRVSRQPQDGPHSQLIPSTYQHGPPLDHNQHPLTPPSPAATANVPRSSPVLHPSQKPNLASPKLHPEPQQQFNPLLDNFSNTAPPPLQQQ
ncbi:hypothetical protein E4T56_gene19565 [Termitomyces sp. T112]|nr:hypothetical protein E4T56_gene19565 [Termitomyces sp. T112]